MAILANRSDLLIDFANYQNQTNPGPYYFAAKISKQDQYEEDIYYNILADGINNPTSYYIDRFGNTYPDNTNSNTIISFLTSPMYISRPIPGVGIQKDKISSFIFQGPNTGGLITNYSYLALQKAVAILIETTDGGNTTIHSGAIKTITANTTLSFDTTQSRGADLGKSLLIEYLNSSNSYTAAIVNVDYQITNTTPNLGTFSIKFLTAKHFRLTFTANGYTSSNNPYQLNNSLYTPTGPNSSNITYYINASSIVYNNIITFPSIDVNIVPDIELATNPVITYENSNITVSSNILINTGSWTVVDTSTGIQTQRTMSLSDWIDELTNRCNVTLEIRDKITGDLILNPFQGLGPFTFNLPEGDYNLQFVTVKK